MISPEDIATVKSRANIEDVITRSGVTLHRSGAGSLKGLCPFHNEKSPSFTVRALQGTFRCFGCGISGDVIQYIREKENLSFTEAVLMLADQYGVEIKDSQDEEHESGPSRRRLYEVLAAAAKFYAECYEPLPDSHPAKQEIINKDLQFFARACGVGYCPDGWTATYNYLTGLGFTPEEIEGAGLVGVSAKSGRHYDLFTNRLTWEIRDISGRVIGFSARKLDEESKGPKYLNSPETKVYKKTQVLLGFDTARIEAAKQRLMYVVEGSSDVAAFRAAGVNNVVASCGTAFGDVHAASVRRVVGPDGTIVFCFDGDAAGLKAARSTFDLKTPIHAASKAVVFENGDPCDVRKREGNSGLLRAIEDAVPLTEFVLKYELKSHDIATPEGRSRYLASVAPILAGIPDISLRADYIQKVALYAGTTLAVVEATVTQAARESRDNSTPDYVAETSARLAPTRTSTDDAFFDSQRRLLALIIQHPLAAAKCLDDLQAQDFDPVLRPLAQETLRMVKENPTWLETTRPDQLSSPELAMELATMHFPMIETAVARGVSPLAAAERTIKQLLVALQRLRTIEDRKASQHT